MEDSLPTLQKDVVVHESSPNYYFRRWQRASKTKSAIKSHLSTHVFGGISSGTIPGSIETAHVRMKRRENKFCSDRIQIIANVCRLNWKLKTTLLNNSTQSYSTCLLALTMANMWPNPVERTIQGERWGDTFMDGDIRTVLKELKSVQRGDLWRLSSFSPEFFRPY